jgi:hypothetical protein
MDAKFKNLAGDILSNLVGTEGLRTDVSITFPAQTIIVLLLVLPITVAGGILLADALRKALK